MTNLSRKLARLESLASPAPRVWIEDLDDAGTVVCVRTGERIAVEDARRLADGDIVVRYVEGLERA